MASTNKQDKQDKKNKKIIKIRGHHLDFLYCWIGEIDNEGAIDKKAFIEKQVSEGYGKRNAAKTLKLINLLYNNKVEVKIIRNLDDICTGCKLKVGDCRGDKYPPDLDKRVAFYYGLKPGRTYSPGEIIGRLRRKKKTYEYRNICNVIGPYD